MSQIRPVFIALFGLLLLVLAGCSGPGGGGGYYKDDGPGGHVPADIEAIPDATPRIETHAKANFRPYVVFGKRYVPVSDEKPFRQEGTASWYGRKFHGKKTANGEIYDMYAMTAAHTTLPLPSYARVTRASTGKSVIVRINDRGPFHSSRIIDLSYVAAAKLGLIGPGSGQVIVEAITNEDIRNGRYEPPKATPVPPATPPAPAPGLTTRATPVAPVVAPAVTTSVPASTVATNPDALAALPPTTPQPESQAQQIYLQFAAFSVEQSAEKLAQDINTQIEGVESRQAQVQTANQLYRVRVGPYRSRTEAVNASLRIQEATGHSSSVALH